MGIKIITKNKQKNWVFLWTIIGYLKRVKNDPIF